MLLVILTTAITLLIGGLSLSLLSAVMMAWAYEQVKIDPSMDAAIHGKTAHAPCLPLVVKAVWAKAGTA